jgi:hypothetical protein
MKGETMKTKAQILEGIEAERALLRRHCLADNTYKEMLKTRIQALRWALGYKDTDRYFCSICQKSHVNLKCPKCGDSTDLG